MINPISVNNTINAKKSNVSDVSFGARKIPDYVSRILKKNLLSAKSVDIFVHVSPDTDPDAATTASILAAKLQKRGVKTNIRTSIDKINSLIFNPIAKNTKNDANPAEVSILVDVNETKRIAQNPSGKVFVFDHHLDTGNIKGAYKYIDESARSCSGMMFRLLKSWNMKISKEEAQNLLYGVYDDFIKSKYIKIVDSQIVETPLFKVDKDSQEVVNGIKKYLSKAEQEEVYKKLDVLSNLTDDEKNFQNRLFKDVKITSNGKLAYMVIDPEDAQWQKLGMDNTRTSTILRDFRMRLINGIYKDQSIPADKRESLKNIQGAIVFYKVSGDAQSPYQMSIHTKNNYAAKLLNYIKKQKDYNPELEQAGGHSNRAGGRILSSKKEDIEKYVNKILNATDKIN